MLILAGPEGIFFAPIIRKSNYRRCSRPVPAPANIPLVEHHSSGGGGDGQQVRFYCILLKITKYFKIPFKKYFHTLDRAQILFRLFSGWFVRRTTRTIYWPLPPGQHPGLKVTFRPASSKQARYTFVRKKLEGSYTSINVCQNHVKTIFFPYTPFFIRHYF